MRKVLVSPHNDDAALFAAFTCLIHQPLVVTVFDSFIQPARLETRRDLARKCDKDSRRAEDAAAMVHLGCEIKFVGFSDADDSMATELGSHRIRNAVFDLTPPGHDVEIWAPLEELGGHAQHNAVARAFDGLNVHRYPTYTRDGGRTRIGEKVEPCDTSWVLRKLRALACYESQICIAQLGCWPWFMGDQSEYVIRAGK